MATLRLTEHAKWEERRYRREPSATHRALIEYAIESTDHLIGGDGRYARLSLLR